MSDKTLNRRLTLDERLQVACYHSIGAKHALWQVDPATGHMLCSLCGKPSALLVLRICATCDNEFVLNFDHPRWQPKFFALGSGEVIEREFECDDCY